MTQATFGRRGLASKAGPETGFRPASRAAAEPSDAVSQLRSIMPSQAAPDRSRVARFLDRIPFFTITLMIGFFVGFSYQERSVGTTTTGVHFSTASLIAMGAASYDLVVGRGDWWRIFLAPLLHGSSSHMIGNATALLIAGFRLEPMLGRWWFLTIFCVSALGGMAGSLTGNPAAVVTVGASGGLSGLLGALFFASFHHKADELSNQTKMRRTALAFGVPALLPMFFDVHNGVDYAAHLGGAITGAVIAIILCQCWPGDERRPRGSFVILLVPVAYFSLATIGIGYAARDFRTYRSTGEESHSALMSDSDLPKAFKLGEAESASLVARFPNDPRAHLLRGVSLASASRFGAAEYEFRTALDRFKVNEGLPGHDLTVALLAFDLAAEARKIDAHEVAAPLCALASRPSDIETLLTKSHVCDPIEP